MTGGCWREGRKGTAGKDGRGLGWAWGAARVAQDCHSRESGNPGEWAGSQGPGRVGVGRVATLGGEETTLDSRLQPAGMTEGETGGQDRRGLAGRTEGDCRAGRKGTGGNDRRGPAGRTEGDWVGRGVLPASHRTVIPAKAGIQGNGRESGTRGPRLDVWRLWGEEKRPWIPAYNRRE